MADIRSDAQFILLVEKDAAFMRLAEDRFYNTYPCIILTAKGQPDVATRWVTTAAMLVEVSGSSRVTPRLRRSAMGQTDEGNWGEESVPFLQQCAAVSLACLGLFWRGVRPACKHAWRTSKLTAEGLWKLANCFGDCAALSPPVPAAAGATPLTAPCMLAGYS